MKQLDLHGIKHSEVKKILDQFIWENMKKNQKEVSVITGISNQMKRVVKECVDDYNMTYQEDFLNPGKIIIKLL
jgi:DNA-nicking Smr family endonuclease